MESVGTRYGLGQHNLDLSEFDQNTINNVSPLLSDQHTSDN